MIEAILFDFDGTIADTLSKQKDWFIHWGNINGKKISFTNLSEFTNFYNKAIKHSDEVQHVYDLLDLPCDMNDKSHPVWPAYGEFSKNYDSKFYKGIKKTIRTIWEMGSLENLTNHNRRIILGINTSNTWEIVGAKLKQAGLAKYFHSYITKEVLDKFHGAGNGEAVKKPAKVSIALALGLMNVNGNKVIHIGDTLNDLASSQKVMMFSPNNPENLITVGACYGYEGRKSLEKGILIDEEKIEFDYLIDKPTELIEIVKKYLK